ncbi:MAG TPA: hypothetical protein VN700_05450 [Vicinamibacterales bacterium]|nr:hypothetical protein [Vicinamibacterales bacterium]
MRLRTTLKLAVVFAFAAATMSGPLVAVRTTPVAAGPALKSIGPLAFGPAGVLFAGDRDAASIYALNLGSEATGGAPGTADVAGIDQKIAAVLGTAATEVAITDLAVHPTSKNTFVSVMRGQGAEAQPALLRVDGKGAIHVVDLAKTTFTSVTLPNPPAATPGARQNPRTQTIMDLGFANGRLIVAGLSNEEFASKLWSVPYPFAATDRGTSIEIFHGNHARLETNSPIFSFVPYNVSGQPNIIAGYLCTPLVKIPLSALKPGEKVLGTTVAELGAGNRPIDMILYSKNGQDYLLMSNTSRGVMKIPTSQLATNEAITARIGGTKGTFETIASMTGVEQLDLLDTGRSIVITLQNGSRNLSAVILP